MAIAPKSLNLPVRRSQHKFALTPLADAMFQLLIFFMLTSNLSPYSFITLKSPAGDGVATQSGAGESIDSATEAVALSETSLWTVEKDRVLVGGQAFEFAQLDALAAALGSDVAPAKVILVVRNQARVQDVALVLEALNNANVMSLQVISQGG